MAQPTRKPSEHGVDHACYANGPYGFLPFIECLCGWGAYCDSWEDVGQLFDDHLAEVKQEV